MKDYKYTNTISYNAPRKIEIGDIFYFIEEGKAKTIRQTCPVCKGEKKLTVNGITFDCPKCSDNPKIMSIKHFVVRAYKVYSIAEEITTDAWNTNGKSVSHSIIIKLFRKDNKRLSSQYGYNLQEQSFRFNSESGNIEINRGTNNPVYVSQWLKQGHSYIYDDYKLAVEFADRVNASEKKKIDDYNKKYNTVYEYPDFSDDKNDKKEKKKV